MAANDSIESTARGQLAAASGTRSTLPAEARTSLRIFVSYARADEVDVVRVAQAIESDKAFDVFRDKEDILPAEDWRARLESLISQADTFLFCLTPHSLASEVCRWEIDIATRLSKRVVPAVLRDAPDATIPPAIAKLNFIFLRHDDEFDAGIERLRFALQADIAWIREHTRIGELARQWDRDGRRTGDLFRGPALEAAERWIATQPPEAPSPADLHRAFITAGRVAATRRQRNWVAGSLAVAVVAVSLSIIAWLQRQEAVAQRTDANARRLSAEAQLELSDPLASSEQAAQRLLASLRLKYSDEAQRALKVAVSRLEPLPIGSLPWPALAADVRDLRFSRDGAWLVAITGEGLLAWDLKTQALRIDHPAKIGEAAATLVFSADGGTAAIAVGATSATEHARHVLLANLTDATVVEHDFDLVLDVAAVRGRIIALVADSDAAHVRAIDVISNRVVWETMLPQPITVARLIEPADIKATPSLLELFAPPERTPSTLLAGASGGVVLAGANGRISLWRFDRNDPLRDYMLAQGARVAAFGEKGAVMAVRSATGPLRVLDVTEGKELWHGGPGSEDGPILFTGNDRFVFVKDGGELRLQSIAGGLDLAVQDSRRSDYDMRALANVERYSAIIDAQATDDGALLATAWKDGRIDVWRPGVKPRYGAIDAVPRANFESVARFDHGDTLGASVTWSAPPPLFVSPTGRFVASQSMGVRANTVGGIVAMHPLVRIWSTRSGREVARWHRAGAMKLVFSPREDLVASFSKLADASPPRLELWRLSEPQSEVRREQLVFEPALPRPIDPAKAAAFRAAATANETVWISADRKLCVLDDVTRRVMVLDDLAPPALAAYAAAKSALNQLLAKTDKQHRSMMANMRAVGDPYEGTRPQIDKLSPESPLTLYPIAVSGDRKRAVVKIASTLRVYALDDKRFLESIDLGDALPAFENMLFVTEQMVMSPSGRAIAATVVTADDAARIATADWRAFGERMRERSRGTPPLEFERHIVVYSVEKHAQMADLKDKIEVLPILTPGPLISLTSKPLAVSDDGRFIVLERPGYNLPAGAPPEFTSRIDIVDTDKHNTRVAFPATSMPSPLDFFSTPTAFPKAAAFSASGRRLVIDDTRHACPPKLTAHPTTMMPMSVPSCTDLRTTLSLWDVERGKRINEQTWDWTPEGTAAVAGSMPMMPFAPALRSPPLALIDENIAQRTIVDTTPMRIGDAEQWHVTHERIALDQPDPLPASACARLPRELRAISAEAWIKALPGEAYRSICEPSAISR